MSKNIKSIFFVSILLILLVGVTAVNANDVSDDTAVVENTADNIAPEITSTATNDNSIQTTKKIETKNNLKKESNNIIVNNDTASTVFSGENNTLSDTINEGDTLDFQGTISDVTGLTSLIINKPINIITSTNDGRIERFNNITYNTGASGSNITGLYTYNMQFYVANAHNITFNNISNVVNSSSVGWGVGQTSIRDNSTNIIVNNSFLYTKDNGGSTSIALTYCSNCTIENTIIQGEGNVGNILYLNTFNPTITTPENNCYNTIRNNTLYGPARAAAICWAISIYGHDNLFENNKLYYSGIGMQTAYGGTAYNNTFIGNEFHNGCGFNNILNSTLINNTAYDNGEIILGANNSAINNTGKITANQANCILGGNNITTLTIGNSNVIIQNNTITSISGTIKENNKFENNTVLESLTISNTMTLKNNTINGVLTINCSSSTINNNTLNQIVIQGNNIKITNNNITGVITFIAAYPPPFIPVPPTLCENCIIQNNTIITSETYTIIGNVSITDAKNTIVTDNYLKSSDKYGDESVNLDFETNTIENNTPTTELIIDTTTFTAGQTNTIIASIYFDSEVVNTINKGKITFKVNGKTLKDTNGKVIYAKVVNGTATIEDYLVPDDWSKEGTTIQAVYSGSTQCEKLTSEKTNIKVEKAAPTFTTESVTGSAGTTVQLKANITDGDKVINTGKVVFKINGKTVKDTNGKVIYAKVVNNQVIVNYTLPADMKAKEYNITATFISSDYERIEDTKTLTITA